MTQMSEAAEKIMAAPPAVKTLSPLPYTALGLGLVGALRIVMRVVLYGPPETDAHLADGQAVAVGLRVLAHSHRTDWSATRLEAELRASQASASRPAVYRPTPSAEDALESIWAIYEWCAGTEIPLGVEISGFASRPLDRPRLVIELLALSDMLEQLLRPAGLQRSTLPEQLWPWEPPVQDARADLVLRLLAWLRAPLPPVAPAACLDYQRRLAATIVAQYIQPAQRLAAVFRATVDDLSVTRRAPPALTLLRNRPSALLLIALVAERPSPLSPAAASLLLQVLTGHDHAINLDRGAVVRLGLFRLGQELIRLQDERVEGRSPVPPKPRPLTMAAVGQPLSPTIRLALSGALVLAHWAGKNRSDVLHELELAHQRLATRRQMQADYLSPVLHGLGIVYPKAQSAVAEDIWDVARFALRAAVTVARVYSVHNAQLTAYLSTQTRAERVSALREIERVIMDTPAVDRLSADFLDFKLRMSSLLPLSDRDRWEQLASDLLFGAAAQGASEVTSFTTTFPSTAAHYRSLPAQRSCASVQDSQPVREVIDAGSSHLTSNLSHHYFAVMRHLYPGGGKRERDDFLSTVDTSVQW